MSNYVKPQSPIYNRKTDTYIYPLTTASQIIMDESGNRLSVEGIKNVVTPENIGAMSMELLWENASPTSEFAAGAVQTSKKVTDYQFIMITTKDVLSNSAMGPVEIGTAFRMFGISSHIAFRQVIMTDEYTIDFSDGNNSTPLSMGNVTYNTDNTRIIPWEIYGIKGVY